MLTGLSAFPITPSDESGAVDGPALRRLLQPIVAAAADSIGLLGSTGTYMYLSRAERRRALEIAASEVAGRLPILVGVGALRTDEAVRLAQDAKVAGATVGLLAPVSYTPLTDHEVYEHYAKVAGESGLPLCIYDNPATTHFRFGPELVGRLAEVPGIIAAKIPAADRSGIGAQLEMLRGVTPAGFSLGCSVDWHATEGLIAGANAWYSVAGGLLPARCAALVRATQSGRSDEARRLDRELTPLWELFREFSSLRVCYAIAGLRGLCRDEPPRPILPLPPAARDRIARTIEAASLA